MFYPSIEECVENSNLKKKLFIPIDNFLIEGKMGIKHSALAKMLYQLS
jgi:hypothetical protein